MKALVISLLILSSCATGPKYTGREQGNVVVYRQKILATEFNYQNLNIEGVKACNLGTDGFFTAYISKPALLTGTKAMVFGTSSMIINPNDYIRVTMNYDAIYSSLFHQGVGPYVFTKVPPAQAKQELQSLNQDCL